MQLEDLTPDMIDGATMAKIESMGLPDDIVEKIKERGIAFQWSSDLRRYIAMIPEPKRKRKKVSGGGKHEAITPMKNTYIIRELQDAGSYRDGEIVHSKSLAHAKKMALRRQSFQGTIMRIEDIYGNVLAVKEGGRWRDTNAA